MQFLYVMDLMYAWWYAFQPELKKILAKHSAANVQWLMGGLAPYTTEPMNEHLQQKIASY